MKDKQYKALRKKVQALVDKWSQGTGLDNQRIELCWYRNNYKVPGDEGLGEGAAYCKADWRYQHAEIGFNLPAMLEMDDWTLEYTVVHEILHIFLNELRRTSFNGEPDGMHYAAHEERVATMLAKAFLWMQARK